MRARKIQVAYATINGVTSEPYWFEHKSYFVWDIIFSKSSCTLFSDLPYIKVGDTWEEAHKFCVQLKKQFARAKIADGDKVTVLFGNDGHPIAIGSTRKKDSWVDVRDNFTKKSFKELNILVTSLEMHW